MYSSYLATVILLSLVIKQISEAESLSTDTITDICSLDDGFIKAYPDCVEYPENVNERIHSLLVTTDDAIHSLCYSEVAYLTYESNECLCKSLKYLFDYLHLAHYALSHILNEAESREPCEELSPIHDYVCRDYEILFQVDQFSQGFVDGINAFRNVFRSPGVSTPSGDHFPKAKSLSGLEWNLELSKAAQKLSEHCLDFRTDEIYSDQHSHVNGIVNPNHVSNENVTGLWADVATPCTCDLYFPFSDESIRLWGEEVIPLFKTQYEICAETGSFSSIKLQPDDRLIGTLTQVTL
ncbi:Uncharacterised protein g2068 [Pycnogonum litorale]